MLLAAAGVLLFLSKNYYTAPSSPPDTRCPNCNIILISIDSLRQDHLSLSGYKRKTSPALDDWSAGAFVLDEYIAAAHLTPVSEAALHTSLYPSRNGIINFASLLSPKAKTMAEILKEAGYSTIAMGSSPEFLGGTPAYLLPAITTATSSILFSDNLRDSFKRGFDQYFEEYPESPGQLWSQPKPKITDWKEYSSPQFYRGLPMKALDFLAHKPKGRFFLWLTVGTVHWPYNDSNKPFYFADQSYDGILQKERLMWEPLGRIYKNKLWPSPREKQGKPLALTQSDIRFIIDRYDDGIFLTDQFLGLLFQKIKEVGLEKNTIVIVTSSHGEGMGEHGYFAHYDIFDTEIYVPLIIKIPGLGEGRVKEQISNIDVLPTVLELVGVKPPPNLDGRSFASLLYPGTVPGDAKDFRPYVFIVRTPLWETLLTFLGGSAEISDLLADFRAKDLKGHYKDIAVRTREWKLIYRESKPILEKIGWRRFLSGDTSPIPEYELYNLKDDPQETVNVIQKYPAVADSLKRKLFAWKEYLEKESVELEQIPVIQPYF